MIYSLIFTVTGALDGVTRVNQPIPAAEDGTGLMRFDVVGNLGGLAWEMLEPIAGVGGYLVCGVGVQLSGGAGWQLSVGIVGRTSASVMQAVRPLNQLTGTFPAQPPYVERPFYVPPEYRLCFQLDNEGGSSRVLRLDIAPLTSKQAARALKIVRPNLFASQTFP